MTSKVIKHENESKISSFSDALDPTAEFGSTIGWKPKKTQDLQKDQLTVSQGELDTVVHKVVEAITKNEIVSENIEITEQDTPTKGQRLTDQVATLGGSWIFIILFGIVICFWILANSFFANKGFDPYPYIFLNLILSCLTVLQAPVIMMSQNRKESKDRIRGEYDFKVNLRAELEIQLFPRKG